jgi:tetratricopeptide (TPR) repeat protein
MYYWLAIFWLIGAVPAIAQSAADERTAAGVVRFTAAYAAWDGAGFAAAAAVFRQATTNRSATVTNFYWLGVAEFHRLLYLQYAEGAATNRPAVAAALEAALSTLTTAAKLDDTHAETHALLGTLYGLKINGSLLRGVRFGPRVQKHRERALALGPENARVRYLLGMCQFHTSSRAGEWRETLTTLRLAEKLFESEQTRANAPLTPHWGHSSCLTFIGRTYEQLNDPGQAATYFRQALKLHPADHVAKAGLARVSGGR